jgi:hypothetical protein
MSPSPFWSSLAFDILTSVNIVICCSLDFTHEIKEIADNLIAMGHKVEIPLTSRRILNGEITVKQIKTEKERGVFSDRAIEFDSIRKYWPIIEQGDAILVANYNKKGIKDYVGGNSFLEMGFAHILNKPIYLLNDIPTMLYSDEIKAMQPIALRGNVNRIKES